MWKWLFCLTLISGATTAAADPWLLRMQPVELLVGDLNLRLDYAWAEHWSSGAEFEFVDRQSNGIQDRARGGTAYLTYHFSGAFTDGFYLDGGVGTSSESARDKSSGRTAGFQDVHTRWIFGYHWFAGRFFVAAGGGVGTHSAGTVVIADSSGHEVDRYDVRPVSLALDLAWGFHF
jgi:hypothetical protein